MRPIKFRAWEKNLKAMISVDSINFEAGLINMELVWRTFEEIEIMQCTGLKDKNGVEIYEGDIVSVQNGEYIKPIIFYQGAFFAKDLFPYEIPYDCKVIGSIYENPELLKEQNK